MRNRKFEDLSGQKFNRLLVLSYHGRGTRNEILWNVLCDCGKTKVIVGATLKDQKTKSCGCLCREKARISKPKHSGCINHVLTREYVAWRSMRGRCLNVNNPKYKIYGGRGITICERWDRFENFLFDMGNRPDKHSIDRIDNNGNYEPSNCRWATNTEQARNKNTSIYLTFKDQTKTLIEWSIETGLNYKLLHSRVYATDWSNEKILTTKSRNKYKRTL